MVAVVAPDWRIAAISANCAEYIGVAADQALGQQAAAVFDPDTLHAIRNRMTLLTSDWAEGAERLFDLPAVEGGSSFDMMVQVVGESALIDVVPTADSEGLDVAALVGRMARRCARSDGLEQLGANAARCIWAMTGFDRVGLWRSDDALIASCERSPGAHPITPPPHCERVRFVADIQAPACAMLADGANTPDTSRSLLAPVSGHMDENMASAGARSALFVPLTARGRRWGSIAAYHSSPRLPGLARISAVEIFAQMLGLEIGRFGTSA